MGGRTLANSRRIHLKRAIYEYLSLVGMAAVVLGLDQWTKTLVRNNLQFGEVWSPWGWLAPYARIVHWKNTGAAFGMLPGFSDVFTILAIIVAIAILIYFPQVPRQDWPLRLAMGLQLGGALGNLIDRLTVGHVTDFISVGTFPVFNVADASISVGVTILVIGMWWKERAARAAGEQPPEQDDTQTPFTEKVEGD